MCVPLKEANTGKSPMTCPLETHHSRHKGKRIVPRIIVTNNNITNHHPKETKRRPTNRSRNFISWHNLPYEDREGYMMLGGSKAEKVAGEVK